MPTTPLPDRSAAPNLTSYEQERATYSVQVPARFNPTLDIVERWGAEAPDELALVSLGPAGATLAEHTSARLSARARMAARALLEQGVRPGDRVFIMLPRVPAWYEAMLGAIRIGAVVMPGTNQLTAPPRSTRSNRSSRHCGCGSRTSWANATPGSTSTRSSRRPATASCPTRRLRARTR
jgi:acyl-coenzyme A synthetase/AMP-(fatty) acid ligase